MLNQIIDNKMTIKSYKNIHPKIHETAYIDEQSSVIGSVEIGEDSAMWPQAVARGDINPITIGKRTNVQDGTIIHVTHKSDYSPGYEVRIGNDVTIGHSAIIHACKIEDRVLVGMGSIILDGAIIQHDVMLGNSVASCFGAHHQIRCDDAGISRAPCVVRIHGSMHF